MILGAWTVTIGHSCLTFLPKVDSFRSLNQTRSVPLIHEWNSCMRRYRTIPPLQFLLGFEAAARLGSFSKAALELGLSQSAVSHEMRLLEDRIGQPLFLRVGRSVQLTDAGQVYQRVVREALNDLDAAQQRLEPFRRQSSVVIYAPRDFGRLWMLPRLNALRLACPNVQPWLDTSGAPIDFTSMEISIGIVYASEPPGDFISQKLATDSRVPVTSSLALFQANISLERLAAQPLIHDEKLPGWTQFFEELGFTETIAPSGLDFSDSDVALAAAEAGLGVALASQTLADAALRSKLLWPLSALNFDPKRSWYAITTEQELSNLHTALVWGWLGTVCEV
jgi:LysR family transcriptional regulator, glycine cleavage system transcriptional activator